MAKRQCGAKRPNSIQGNMKCAGRQFRAARPASPAIRSSSASHSVLCSRLLQQAPRRYLTLVQRVDPHPKPRARFIEPMECTRVTKLPQGKDWIYEIKQDGYRAIALVDRGTAMLHSMSGKDYSAEFKQ